MDGGIYQWRIKDFLREKENVKKGCNYADISVGKDGTIYAVGSD